MVERSASERALRAEMGEVRALIAELRVRCELLTDHVAVLREMERRSAELMRLADERDRLREAENRALTERVAQLEARLGRNSRNSNTPGLRLTSSGHRGWEIPNQERRA